MGEDLAERFMALVRRLGFLMFTWINLLFCKGFTFRRLYKSPRSPILSCLYLARFPRVSKWRPITLDRQSQQVCRVFGLQVPTGFLLQEIPNLKGC